MSEELSPVPKSLTNEDVVVNLTDNQGSITFSTKKCEELFKLGGNGDIFVKGKLVENNIETVNGFKEWLKIVRGEQGL